MLERRMIGDLIETLKINGIFSHGRYFFSISPGNGNFLSRQISKTKSTNQLDFFASRVIYFWNELPIQLKNGNGENKKETKLKMKLGDFRKNSKKKNLSGHYYKLLDEFDLYIDIVSVVYMFCANFFFC